MEPFGWYIEAEKEGLRWFTRERSRVGFWQGKPGVKVTALVQMQEEVKEDYTPLLSAYKSPECEHIPDILNRCIKCKMDLTPGSLEN